MNPSIHHWVLCTGLFMLPFISSGQCSETTAHSGSIFSNDASTGSFPFSNPGNIISEDNNRASATALLTILSGNTNVLKASGFGFAIPSSAGICGIKVELKKSATGINIFAWVSDESVQLVKSGNTVGSNKASPGTWSSSENYASYGGTVDKWGTDWTPEEINDPSFGIAFSAHIAGLISLLPSARIDHARITVYYNVVLPLAIERFEAKPGREHSATLNWSLADTDEMRQLSIQRETSQGDWTTIYTHNPVAGKWNGSNFSYTDNNCTEAAARYRLAITTIQGNTEYSKVVTVRWETGELQLYPNPAATHLFISGKLPGNTVTCTNASGQTFLLPLQPAGVETYKVDIVRLQPGTWFVRLNDQWKMFLKR